MENVLQRIRHCLKTAVTNLTLTEKEHREITNKHRVRLTKLQNNADSFINTMEAELSARSLELYNDVLAHLQTKSAQLRICAAWKPNEIPDVSEGISNTNHWNFIKFRIEDAFCDRVCAEVENWSEEEGIISRLESELVNNIEVKLGILQKDILDSECELDNACSLDQSNGSTLNRRNRRKVSLKPAQIDLPMKMPLKINYQLSNLNSKRQARKFKRDPKKWTKQRSEKLMKKLLRNKKVYGQHEGPLDMLIHELMSRPRTILDTLELKIPSIIEANIDLLNRLEKMSVDRHRDAQNYEKMGKRIEVIKESVTDYGEEYIFVTNFRSNEIRVPGENNMSYNINLETFNMKTNAHFSYFPGQTNVLNNIGLPPCEKQHLITLGMLQFKEKEKPITILQHALSSENMKTALEVSKIR